MKNSVCLILTAATIVSLAALPKIETASAARPVGAATFGNPDHPWGTRRSVTEADRGLIARYRSTSQKPVLEENFSNAAELQSLWSLQSDDDSGLKSCRRSGNVVITDNELQLRTQKATDCRAKWSTGSMISKATQKYGFFEARMKIADVSGINNAFWLTTDDHFEIDIAEVHFPNIIRFTLHNNNNWDTIKEDKMHAVGFESKFADNFSQDYHDYGVVWTSNDIVFEVDGEPIVAITTNGSIAGAANIRFSTAVMEYAGKIPTLPAGHHMYVKTLRVFALSK